METPDTNKISKIRIKKKSACLFEADFFFYMYLLVNYDGKRINSSPRIKKKKRHMTSPQQIVQLDNQLRKVKMAQ